MCREVDGRRQELEQRFRAVLIQLELLSNGSIAKMDGNSGGGSVRHYADHIPTLGRHDAPHLYYRDRWTRAQGDAEREQILEAAEKELDAARKSQADPSVAETREERDRRIVDEGDGWPARDVATHFRCGIRDVWAARRAAGRDEETGKSPNGAPTPVDARPERVRELADKGMSARRIAFALGLSYSTVLRDLGRKS